MRPGAGRPARRAVAEDLRRLNVADFQRAGVLTPGRAGSWRWWDAETGATTASIDYSTGPCAVTLAFRFGDRRHRQLVPIDRIRNAGGAGLRPYFLCPLCDRRVMHLYLRISGFACRFCQDLSYRSQRLDSIDRTWLLQARIEAHMGPHLKRPPGMHRRTYARLVAAAREQEVRRRMTLLRQLQSIVGQLPCNPMPHPHFDGWPTA